MAVATIAAVTLGIVVDDTIHFIEAAQRAPDGQCRSGAGGTDCHATGRPGITITTAVLAAGFSCLYFSGFQINAWMGLMTAIVICVALYLTCFYTFNFNQNEEMALINKLTVLTMTTVLAGAAFAQSPEEGMEIALETERRDSGFGDYVVEGNMLLQSPDGGSGQRRFSMYTLEIESDGDKRLVEFHQPRDLEV